MITLDLYHHNQDEIEYPSWEQMGDSREREIEEENNWLDWLSLCESCPVDVDAEDW